MDYSAIEFAVPYGKFKAGAVGPSEYWFGNLLELLRHWILFAAKKIRDTQGESPRSIGYRRKVGGPWRRPPRRVSARSSVDGAAVPVGRIRAH
jgi:hypothetical protein